MRSCQTLKLAFLGTTGVGKDTCVQIVQKIYPHFAIQVIRLAEPLYEAQRAIYKICGQENGSDFQDGILLNFLGQHMRKINSRVLTDAFAKALLHSDADLILCGDVRPIDAPFMKELGFTLIHVLADPSLTIERRKIRGDLTLSNANHPTEMGSFPCDAQIKNDGTIEELEIKIREIIDSYRL